MISRLLASDPAPIGSHASGAGAPECHASGAGLQTHQ